MRVNKRRWPLMTLPVLLLSGWLWIAGTYSPGRDLAAVCIATGITFLLKVLWAGCLQRRAAYAGGIYQPKREWVTPSIAWTWVFICWVTLSSFDAFFERQSIPLRGNLLSPKGMSPQLRSLRVGVSLSGGGYRAALLHSGVLLELSAQGIPVTNLSTVSGGSIIGSFLSIGGDPEDFVEAVKQGRFRFKRELLSALNLPRWILPFGSYTRRDVQAGLVRRVLLSMQQPPTSGKPQAPLIMLAMTDLSRAISIGVTSDGFMTVGPTTSRYFRDEQAISLNGIGDMASMVAISGAFPGVFPAKRASMRFTVVSESLSRSNNIREIELLLSDGGVRDNLGLRLLEVTNEHARGTSPTSISWDGFSPGPQWAMDVIIISDGGKSLDAEKPVPGFISETIRSIDVASLETGILRPIELSSKLPKISLSLASSVAPGPDAALVGIPNLQSYTARYFYFNPLEFSPGKLERIVQLVPDQTRAQMALANFGQVRGPINMSLVNQHCVTREPDYEATSECRWWQLVNVVGEDIEQTISVFKGTSTLQDNFDPDDADAIVRLGRYFTLLKWNEIDDAVMQTSACKK